jgi:hypothetical protein
MSQRMSQRTVSLRQRAGYSTAQHVLAYVQSDKSAAAHSNNVWVRACTCGSHTAQK